MTNCRIIILTLLIMIYTIPISSWAHISEDFLTQLNIICPTMPTLAKKKILICLLKAPDLKLICNNTSNNEYNLKILLNNCRDKDKSCNEIVRIFIALKYKGSVIGDQ